ncbi:MAG: M4 family metallopeptidase, partial [Bacteroidetes bacterium]|nr:M4 family metallopeptidase [Bacteroidota bacterium]
MRIFNSVIVITLLSFITASSFAQKPILFNEKFGAEASAIFPNAQHVWLKQENSVPAFIDLRSGNETDESTFLFLLKKKFNLPSSYQFQLLDNVKDEIGWEHHRYQLLVNSIPVADGIFITHLQNGKVKKFNGSLFKNIPIAPSPTFSESAALAFALQNINAKIYKWQLSEEEELLKQMNSDAHATYFPKGQLEIVQSNNNENNFRLAWKFDVYAHEPMSRNEVFVDAETGEVLGKKSRIYNANTAGTAVTAYRGSRPIVADSYTGQYRLYETTRGLGIHTYNMQTGTNYGTAVEFLDANNIWSNVNAAKDQYACDAHWGAEMTYDFYQSMGRNSIDNAGYALNLYMHYNTNYVNAFWDGTRMTFGDGNATNNPLTSLDITGHEISHGLDELTANLTYQDEPGALNESFSDIFGTAVEWFADSTVANWTIGEDIGSPFRSMSSPNTYGDPDTYLGTNWYTGTGDNGGVHTNSNVQNFWYYLLSQGGTGTNDIGNAYTVTGISRHKATQIAWRNMVFYLTNNSQYADSRFYAIQSANDLFGTCSPEAIATTNAWYAVGVGAQFTFGVDAQFTASQTSGCMVPFVVNFTNASTNASTYNWDFGDGTTSTAQAPSHTYTNLGTYTVRLISNGGACGIDSLIRTNYINISTSNPCVVVMPTTGTYQTQTSCTGTIYDSGGPTGNYTDNTNSVLTISPAGATQVRFHFTQFNMENTYDFLYVYDGPTTASPQIGAYTGTTIPADITSSGGSLTIRQTTDVGVVAAGYTIQWSCISPTIPPVANFKADVTSSCNGKINFNDLSTSAPTSWLWNFGDGGTSTLQNPSHTYFTNGTFSVSLKATNAYGNNTNTKNNYITINKPAAPVAANVSRCGNGTVLLAAISTDTIKWYANATDTTSVSVSNPFVTPSLSSNTIYYAEDIVPGATAHVGPVNDSIGAVSNYSNITDRYLIFNCLATSTLKTVKVYAQGAGNRTIVLRDSTGAILQTLTVNLASGLNIVSLNFVLPVKNNLRLTINGTANLFRNTAGGVYPYTLAGLVSITGTNGTAGYYYYFYDWVIKSSDCVSLRKAVTATINPAVVAASSHANVLCNGGNTGTATVSATGGTPSFSYTWTGGATTTTANNLVAGIYNVTVIDAAGCSSTSTQMITQPTALSLTTSETGDTCNRSTGKIISTVSGGTTNYSYNWSNSQTSSTVNNLPSGNFALTVTDANNCSLSASAIVNAVSSNLSINATSTNVLCNGGNTGSVTASVTGGFPNVIYHWSNNASGSAISNLVAGNYSVTVTDGGGCSVTATKTISQPLALSLTTTTTDDTCGRGTGKIISTVSGGTT